MAYSKFTKLSLLFVILILPLFSTACSAYINTFNSNPPVEHTQLLSPGNMNIGEETSEPVKEPLKLNADSEFDKKDNTNFSKSQSNFEVVETTDLDTSKLKIPVLMYHSINVNSTNDLIMTPEEFEAQVKWLKDNNFTTLSLDELHSMLTTGKAVPAKPVVLTFDDGYEDNYTEAYPILKKYNFKATIFLITDSINKPSYLNDDQIIEMFGNNIDFQSHTVKHPELNKISYEEQLNELISSRDAINNLLNKKTEYLCYPVGKYNDDTIKAAKNADYKMAFTTKHGHAKQSDGFYKLTRVRMSPGMSMEVLNNK